MSDAEVNGIWDVGAYIVFLNMQEYLLDVIKRDCLVRAENMHPEVKTVQSIYDNCRVIPKSLDFVMSGMGDKWLYNIPTYSSWWIIVLKERFVFSGDFTYIERHHKTVLRLV